MKVTGFVCLFVRINNSIKEGVGDRVLGVAPTFDEPSLIQLLAGEE